MDSSGKTPFEGVRGKLFMKQHEKQYSFFVIEDSRGDFALTGEYLNEQFELPSITRAATFQEAHRIFDNVPANSFDCILLDLSLPDKSGEDLIEAVVKMSENTPIVVLTGYPDLDFSVKSLSKGVSDYLLKDEVTPQVLYKAIVFSIKRSDFSDNIKESEKKYRDLFEHSPEPMWLVDHVTNEFLDVNNAAVEQYGYSKDEFLAMKEADIHDKEQADPAERLRNVSAEPGVTDEVKHQIHRKKSGELVHVEVESSNLSHRGRNASLVLANNVTEKIRSEKQRKLLESVITNTSKSVIILETPESGPEPKIMYVNSGFSESTGYTTSDVMGATIGKLFDESTDAEDAEKLKSALINRESHETELLISRKDGSTFWFHLSIVPVKSAGGDLSHMVITGQDMTKRRISEEKLQNSLKEKEILLSEIHHRVKNNLALVSGMLQMQVFDEENEEVLNKLNNSMLRVETMASIHQLLYESSSFSRLEFSKIIDKLIKATHSSFSADKEIEIEVETEPFELNINQAVPCALIINEVITNVYKHAFKGRDKGWIRAKLSHDNSRVTFKMEDDGLGLPDGFDMSNLSSLGTKIITALVKQLGGTFELTPRKEGGTTFHLEFPVKDEKGTKNGTD